MAEGLLLGKQGTWRIGGAWSICERLHYVLPHQRYADAQADRAAIVVQQILTVVIDRARPLCASVRYRSVRRGIPKMINLMHPLVKHCHDAHSTV